MQFDLLSTLLLYTPVPYVILYYWFLYKRDITRFFRLFKKNKGGRNDSWKAVLTDLGIPLFPSSTSEGSSLCMSNAFYVFTFLVGVALSVLSTFLIAPALSSGSRFPFLFYAAFQALAALPWAFGIRMSLGPRPEREKAPHLGHSRQGSILNYDEITAATTIAVNRKGKRRK